MTTLVSPASRTARWTPATIAGAALGINALSMVLINLFLNRPNHDDIASTDLYVGIAIVLASVAVFIAARLGWSDPSRCARAALVLGILVVLATPSGTHWSSPRWGWAPSPWPCEPVRPVSGHARRSSRSSLVSLGSWSVSPSSSAASSTSWPPSRHLGADAATTTPPASARDDVSVDDAGGDSRQRRRCRTVDDCAREGVVHRAMTGAVQLWATCVHGAALMRADGAEASDGA